MRSCENGWIKSETLLKKGKKGDEEDRNDGTKTKIKKGDQKEKRKEKVNEIFN